MGDAAPRVAKAIEHPRRQKPGVAPPVPAAGTAKLWKRFCIARRGVLRHGWEKSWQQAVTDEG
jgi:hypothetical protein